MAEYTTPVNQFLKSIDIQPYDRYLPNAFNDSLTLLEKVNKVIFHLNETNQLSNEMVKKWNEFAESFSMDSIDKNIEKKMSEFLNEDNLIELIDTELMVDFKKELTESTNEILNNVNEQVTQNVTDLGDILNSDKVSKKVDLTNKDITTGLNDLLSDLKTRNVRYAYFDKETEIQLNNPLEQKDRLLIGKSKISKKHENNVFYYVANSLKSFNGRINKNHCKFTQLKLAILSNRAVNITIWGDSISTNGDLIGANTSNPTSSEFGPDNITEGDSYTSYFYDLFAETMPDKPINFYNRAIGGTNLGEWNALKTFNSVEKTWIDHIKDTNPDVLVIAFGMNHNTYDRARSFAYNVKQVTDYINANFTVKPDLVFISSPRASYHPETAWGNLQEQSSRQLTANIFRNIASKYKAYLIDVNRLSNIKRVGTDWLNPTFEEIDPTPFISKVKTGSSYQLTGTVEIMDLLKYDKDFVLKFTVVFSGHAINGDNLNISYGKTTSTGFNNCQINITPKNTTFNESVIQSLANIADFNNWGNSGQTVLKRLGGIETTLNLRIEKRGNILEIHRETGGIAQGLLVRDKINVWDTVGFISFRHNATTSGFTTTISNLKYYEPVYESYLPDLTEQEAWGVFNPNDTSLKSPYGGNGVNHPSSYGIKEMYLPSVKEFVEDISDVYRNS